MNEVPHPLSSKLRNHQRIARVSPEKIIELLDEHPLTATAPAMEDLSLDYDAKSDTARLRIRHGTIIESRRSRDGLILHIGSDGHVIAVDILDAARRFIAMRLGPPARLTPKPARQRKSA